MAVKAVNDTAGLDGLVPTLLVYGAYPRISDLFGLDWSGSGLKSTPPAHQQLELQELHGAPKQIYTINSKSWHKYSVEEVEVKVANIINIKLDSLLIVLINLSILIAVISIIILIKNHLNSGKLHL